MKDLGYKCTPTTRADEFARYLANLAAQSDIPRVRAAKYLERNGKRFRIDYGTENVIEVARELRRARRTPARIRRKS